MSEEIVDPRSEEYSGLSAEIERMRKLLGWHGSNLTPADWDHGSNLLRAAKYWMMVQTAVRDNPTLQGEWERFLMVAKLTFEEIPGFTAPDAVADELRALKSQWVSLNYLYEGEQQKVWRLGEEIASLRAELDAKRVLSEVSDIVARKNDEIAELRSEIETMRSVSPSRGIWARLFRKTA